MLDKLKVIDNIKLLAKMKKILLSEVEKAGGVTPGYLARLAFDINKFREGHKEGEKERQLPPTDVIEKMAGKLGITIDALINLDFSQVKDAEGTVILFFDNLTKLTNRNTLIWKKETSDSLNSGKHPLTKDKEEPVFDFEKCMETDETVMVPHFYSQFKDKFLELNGPILKLTSRGKTFMLLETIIEYPEYAPDYSYEFYAIEQDNKVLKVASADWGGEYNPATPMYKALSDLYAAASKSADVNPNGDDIIKMINEFMNVFKVDDDKEGDDWWVDTESIPI